MKKILFVLTLGLALVLTSCGDQHKAQSLVKDFLNENLENEDCSFKRFSQLTPTAMIDFNRHRKSEDCSTRKEALSSSRAMPSDRAW